MNELSFRQLRQDLLLVGDLLAQGSSPEHEQLLELTERVSDSLPAIERLLDEISEPRKDENENMYVMDLQKIKKDIAAGKLKTLPFVAISPELFQAVCAVLGLSKNVMSSPESYSFDTRTELTDSIEIVLKGLAETERLFRDGDETIQSRFFAHPLRRRLVKTGDVVSNILHDNIHILYDNITKYRIK